MTIKLDGELKRELKIAKQLYTLHLLPVGPKLTEKGKRNGIELAWKDIVSGDAAMAAALQASVLAGAIKKRSQKTEAKPNKLTVKVRQK